MGNPPSLPPPSLRKGEQNRGATAGFARGNGNGRNGRNERNGVQRIHPRADIPRAIAPLRDKPVYRFAKRAMDLIVGGLLLLAATPLLALLAVAIRLDSWGPVFFWQTRVGEGGREFRMWKLRSMHDDAEDRLHHVAHLDIHGHGRHFKVLDDPRVTRVGGLLRRFSLDELPQLFNVVRGEMSLVGPRPPIPAEVLRYSARELHRLTVPGGLTGLWQVSGRSLLSFDQCIKLDHEYIANRSFFRDLVILIRTALVVLTGHGAY